MDATVAETRHFKCTEVQGPVTYVKGRWYVGSRDVQVKRFKCLRGGSSASEDKPPVFHSSGSAAAWSITWSITWFDWLLEIPK